MKNKKITFFSSLLTTFLIAMSFAPLKASAATLKYSFEVMSDTHIDEGTDVNNNNLARALTDIKGFSRKCKAVVFNGDSVDQYNWGDYAKLRDIVEKYGKGLPFKFFSLGNHELFDDSHRSDNTSTPYSYKLNRFLYFADSINRVSDSADSRYLPLYDNYDTTTVPYYKAKVENSTFVFIGSQSLESKDKADIKDDQFTWLDDNTLYKINKYQERQPIFVFGHQGIKNTVAGTHQGWDGIEQYGALSFILNKYPNVFYFSGHSHWDLKVNGSYPNNIMYGGNPTYNTDMGAVFLTDGGVTESWTPNNGSYTGSTGLHVEVYDNNKVVIKGRDYYNRTWIPGVNYTIDLTPRYKALDKIMPGM